MLSLPRLKTLLPDDLLYAIIGGIATTFYMPARNTQDLDLLILADDAERLEQALIRQGWTQLENIHIHTDDVEIMGGAWRSTEGELLDLLYTPNLSWARAALQPENTTTAPDGLRVISLPYLILLKLLARRNRDILDIEEMLQYCDEQKIAEIRSVISKSMPALFEDLEQHIAIAQMD
jgi:predicted nucleotidyltransferase